jgi:carbon-monoxide dehydrogenase medium subunit
MRAFSYHAPQSLVEAVGILEREGGGGKVLAGGTDLLIHIKERGLVPRYVVSLRDIRELNSIAYDESAGLRIGAAAKLSDVAAHPVVRERYPMLMEAASLVGSLQIQNLGTVVGNLCNAAPSADTAPPLVALDASVQIVGPAGERVVSLEQFFVGPGRTVLQPNELVAALTVPAPLPRSGGAYERFTPRQEMDIAVVGVGSYVALDEQGRCAAARICLGAVAPTPIRSPGAEAALAGQELTPESLERAAELAANDARPISDQRGTADYRRHLVKVLTRRTVAAAWRDARGHVRAG